jgi:hypothetical protein
MTPVDPEPEVRHKRRRRVIELNREWHDGTSQLRFTRSSSESPSSFLCEGRRA